MAFLLRMFAVLLVPSLLGATGATTLSDDATLPSLPVADVPRLSGHHFKITALRDPAGFLALRDNDATGDVEFSGYLIDILDELARPDRANFTYELQTPNGFGSLCKPRLKLNETYPTISDHPEAYHRRYRSAFKCGESLVNDRPISHYSTDMYWGTYYVTPERLQANKFTVPFSPPDRGTLGMMGTATHIRSIPDLAVNNHKYNYAVCAFDGTAYLDNIVLSFPQLDIQAIPFTTDLHTVLDDGTCDVIIDGFPMLKARVLSLYNHHQCKANGDKPIGIIGEPLEYGLNSFAFGIRDDLPDSVVKTLNFWLQALMACYPEDPNGYCPNGEGSLSQMYSDEGGGTGKECGYVQFPAEDKGLPGGALLVIVSIPVVVVSILAAFGVFWHSRKLKEQEKRMKKRFIQQLARNINIGDSARAISAKKLSEAFEHIGGKDGLISKDDLANWLNDIHLDFLSDQDFERLWDTMDMDGTGFVDPIDFSVFLRACEKQFKEVHQEWDTMPKSERIKLSVFRLENFHSMGEEEVMKMQRRMDRRSRLHLTCPSQKCNLVEVAKAASSVSDLTQVDDEESHL